MTLINIRRIDSITGEKTIIFSQIDGDIQKNERYMKAKDNSFFGEIADYFIFVDLQYKNIITGDLVEFIDFFGEKILLQVIGKDIADFEDFENFIELKLKKL